MKELLNVYRAALRDCGGCFTRDMQPLKNRGNIWSRSTGADVAHLLWMLDQMDAMLDQLDAMPMAPAQAHVITKFHRWLGFVQGWMWHQHVFTIDKLREQTRLALEC